MKITKNYLKQLIKEELEKLYEAVDPQQVADRAFKDFEEDIKWKVERGQGFIPFVALLKIESLLKYALQDPKAKEIFKEKIKNDPEKIKAYFNAESGRSDYEQLKAKMKKEFDLS